MKETPISSSLLARLSEATRYVISGVTPATWFGPMQPMKPQAPDDVAGRRFDYPVGYNLDSSPRANEPVTFADLRALADNCDILRSVIETRKDQMEALDWTVRTRNSIKPTDDQKRRIDAVISFLECPDSENSFAQWLRQVLEDMFVIDAVAIYKRRNRAGGISAFEVVDGASIRLLLDASGRTPHSPGPAYQQILKGIPAVDYTRDELIYVKHNPRSHKVYGYSHVEQVLVTVNIMIRRALHQLDYYREGSQPDALIGLPKEWSQDQIVVFQKHFDTLLAGNSALRRRVRFMPGDFKYQETKAPPLKDAYDEFLARIVCFVFSVSPEPFVGQVNRATAESSQARAVAEGLAPLQRFVSGLMNRIVQRELGCRDLEFIWQDTRDIDPKEAAAVDVAYVGAGILTAEEVRARMGLEALPKSPLPPGEGGVRAQKFNPHHVPAGSPEGGQFTTAAGAGGGSGIAPRSTVPQGGTQVSVNAAELIPLAVPVVGTAILAIGAAGRDKVKPVPLNMEGENSDSASGTDTTTGSAAGTKKPEEEGEATADTSSTEHGASRSKERSITDTEIKDAIKSAEESGEIKTQTGKYGTPQKVYTGKNGITVVVETSGRNAGKVVTLWRKK